MRAPEKGCSTKLSTRGGGAALFLAALSLGCGGSTPVVTTPVELPPAARNLLNTDDLAPPIVREGGPLSPVRPVARTAIRRQLVSAVFSPDSKRLFAISTHGELVAYDVESGALRGYARPWYDGTYPQLQVDRSGSRVMTVSPDRAPVLWDLHSDTLRTVPALEGWQVYTLVALHPSGDQVARAMPSADGLAVVTTRLDDGRELRATLPTHLDEPDATVTSYSPSGARLALITDLGSTFTYLNAADLSVVRHESLLDEGQIPSGDADNDGYRVAFRPHGGQLALGRPGRVELLDSLTARVRADAPLSGARVRLDYSADGRWLVASSSDEIVVLESESGRVNARVLLSDAGLGPDDYASVSAVLPGDGGFFVLTQNGDALFFDAAGASQPLPDTAPRDYGVTTLLHSPNGTWQFHVSDVPSITRVGETEPHTRFVQDGSQVSIWGADFSVDGRTLFTRSRNGVSRFGADGMRTLGCGNENPPQRAGDGQIVQLSNYGGCLFDRDVTVREGQLSTRDGRVTASREDGQVSVLREGNDRAVRIAFARTSRVSCGGEDGCLQAGQLASDGAALGFLDATRDGSQRETWWEVYDTRTGRLRAQGTRPDGYFGLRMFAAGAFGISGENTLTLYDARGRQRLVFESVSSSATSNDDRLLVVQTTDRVVHVVDTVALRERETWTAPGMLALVRVTPDGLRIVAREDATAVVTSLDGAVQHRMPVWQDDVSTNFAGTYVLTCEGARAVRVDARTGEQVDFAPCEGRPDAISEDGTLAVMTVGSSTRVHRLSDGRVLTLETLVGPVPAVLVAYDDTGRWDLSHLDAESVRIRAAGPGETAPLDAPDAATRTDGLIGLFLSGQ
jgi:WD40 repeat protein